METNQKNQTINSIYGDYQKHLCEILETLTNRLSKANETYRLKNGEALYEHINGRIKSEQSMRDKCRRRGLPCTPYSALHELTDAIGLRIVTTFREDINQVIETIEHFEDCRIIEKKDYIHNVKPNGYRSYHLILDYETPFEDVCGHTPGHYFVEIQLRTIAMDTWASLEHQVSYKKNIDPKREKLIRQELKRCADELASCDISMQTIRNLIREDHSHENTTR
ncbi:GTP pyrophosphokinase [Pseudoramibacter sp.]|jgi:ppGpp synthetase/RelA/SpoT-type nucleotidyltranferase|uniref:GTP pyrophosphokinase n=1 Tax=Pseudoramibacter sp. TaxID=2034862 RepID=UPI0025CF3CAD|nr:GTP pyrophosphokinase family protein [Pseudoramibacter sp.]MCH4072697.1 GTP pyrophosphokinase family protein [Pseudoramibacter sp.]MCH4106468.1 GTP pyrophosphokinase family protein [Pseudoramibacter sp.]